MFIIYVLNKFQFSFLKDIYWYCNTKKYLKNMREKFDNVLFSMKYCIKENEIHEISVLKQWEILFFFLRGKSIRDNVYFFSPRQHSVFFNSSLAFLSVFHSQLLFFVEIFEEQYRFLTTWKMYFTMVLQIHKVRYNFTKATHLISNWRSFIVNLFLLREKNMKILSLKFFECILSTEQNINWVFWHGFQHCKSM